MQNRTFVAILVLALSTTAGVASADQPDPRQTARVLGEQGVAEYKAGHFAQAFAMFKQAEQMFHAPSLVFFMGECERHSGKLIEARRLYRSVVDEPQPENAPPAYKTALDGAKAGLAEIDRALPHLTITVSGPGADNASVKVDGEPVASTAIGNLEIDPGEHVVEARALDGASARQTVRAGEGATIPVTLALALGGAGAGDEDGKRSRVPAFIGFGVGAIGLGIGGVMGAMSLSKTSTIKSKCSGNQCPASLQGDADSANTLATVSDVGFVLGGVGVAFGLTWLLWPSSTSSDSAKPPAPTATLLSGPGTLAFRTTF